jgi:hypothetical protein
VDRAGLANGGGVRGCVFYRTTGNTGGSAIALIGTDTTHRAGNIIIDRFRISGDANWAKGIYVDGSAITTAGSQGIRSVYIDHGNIFNTSDSQSSIYFKNCVHCYVANTLTDIGAGSATSGVTVTGAGAGTSASTDVTFSGDEVVDFNSDFASEVSFTGIVRGALTTSVNTVTGFFSGTVDGTAPVNNSTSTTMLFQNLLNLKGPISGTALSVSGLIQVGSISPSYSSTATGGTGINSNGQVFTKVTDLTPAATTYAGWFESIGGKSSGGAKGTGAVVMLNSDDASVNAGNKGILYGNVIAISPRVDRNSVPNDDATGMIIQNNGAGKATDAIYIGAGTLVGKQWLALLSTSPDSDYIGVFGGAHTYGMDFSSGTYTNAVMRCPNNVACLTARNGTNSADLNYLTTTVGNNLILDTTSNTGVFALSGLVSGNSAAPTCDSTTRGRFWYVPGAGGVKDVVEVCAKDAADAYAWRAIY